MQGVLTRLTPEIDVYAYGILCVEVLTRGSVPWPLADDTEVRHFVCSKCIDWSHYRGTKNIPRSR